MHLIKSNLLVCLLMLSLAACNSSSVKEKLNKAGDIAGQATGEFAQGVEKGIKKAFDVNIQLPENLREKGITFGKSTVSNDSTGTDNLLTVYVIFNRGFSGTLTARAFDNNDKEMGRATVQVDGKENEARFVEFHFDRRTNIDNDSRLILE